MSEGPKKSALGFDPILKIIGSSECSGNKTLINLKKGFSYNKLHGEWTNISFGGPGNAALVKRSNALLGYN